MDIVDVASLQEQENRDCLFDLLREHLPPRFADCQLDEMVKKMEDEHNAYQANTKAAKEHSLWVFLSTEDLLSKLHPLTRQRFLSLLATQTLSEASGGIWAINAAGHVPMWLSMLDKARALVEKNTAAWTKNLETIADKRSVLSHLPVLPMAAPFGVMDDHVIESLPVEIQIAAWLLMKPFGAQVEKILLARKSLVRLRAFRLGEYASFPESNYERDWTEATFTESPSMQQEKLLHIKIWEQTLCEDHLAMLDRYLHATHNALRRSISLLTEAQGDIFRRAFSILSRLLGGKGKEAEEEAGEEEAEKEAEKEAEVQLDDWVCEEEATEEDTAAP